MKFMCWTRLLLRILVICTAMFMLTSPVLADNIWLWGELRVDISEVYNAGDYQTLLYADELNNAPYDEGTCAWLSIHLAPGDPPHGFAQVGMMIDDRGIYWFVYSGEYDVIPARGGTPRWYDGDHIRGIEGYAYDIVAIRQWHRAQLKREYVPYLQRWVWGAYMYDTYNNPYILAYIDSGNGRIYRAGCVTEELYHTPNHYWIANYYHYQVSYKSGGAWHEWPVSSCAPNAYSDWRDNTSQIFTTGACPEHYGVIPNYAGNPRAWWTGTTGVGTYWCAVNPLFPPTGCTYLPLTLREYQ